MSDFFKRWWEGIKNLSARKQLEAQISFAWGNLIGFFGGMITMIYWLLTAKQYQYWWTVLILAICVLATVVDLIAKNQQMKAMDTMDDAMINISNARL